MNCQGAGCWQRAVNGMSFCSEEHYEELVEERKSRKGYRTALPAKDYTADLQPPVDKHKSPSSYDLVSDERLRKLHDQDLSYAQIGKLVGVEATVIAARCEKLEPVTNWEIHLPTKSKTQLSREKVSDDDLRALRATNLSYKEIGKKYGISWNVIATRCSKLGLGGPRGSSVNVGYRKGDGKDTITFAGATLQRPADLDNVDDLPNVKLGDEVVSNVNAITNGHVIEDVMLLAGFLGDKPQCHYDLVLADLEQQRNILQRQASELEDLIVALSARRGK